MDRPSATGKVTRMGDMHPVKSPLGLRIIGVTKLLSAALLVAVAVGLFRLIGTDMGVTLEHFVRRLHLDPENKVINKALLGLAGTSIGKLKAIDIGAFLYAILYVVEGIGLIMGKHWAEYLTIAATASLIPLEIYELAQKLNPVRASVLLVNVAIVVYLIYRLRKDHKAR